MYPVKKAMSLNIENLLQFRVPDYPIFPGWLMMTLQKLFVAAPQDPDTLENLAFSWEKKTDFRHDWWIGLDYWRE